MDLGIRGRKALVNGDIDEFVAICALSCSAQASYIVGQSLVVDGGVTNCIF